MNYKYQGLENNLIDMVKEEQIKLGYSPETIRLYYPLSSLNKFIGEECDVKQMQERLKEFRTLVQERLGALRLSNVGERFCIAIPPEGAEYVHGLYDKSDFLVRFVRVIEKHGCTIEDIVQVFREYSEHIHVERARHGEFDYLVYFEDGLPDSYRYCISIDECHTVYHRFTREDYEELGYQNDLIVT